jgi:hypothetical protein
MEGLICFFIFCIVLGRVCFGCGTAVLLKNGRKCQDVFKVFWPNYTLEIILLRSLGRPSAYQARMDETQKELLNSRLQSSDVACFLIQYSDRAVVGGFGFLM